MKRIVERELAHAVRQAGAPVEGLDAEGLVSLLGSDDGLVRASARRRLAEMGEPAAGALIEGLACSSRRVRWEAARTLGEVASPVTAPALTKALEDEDPDVRWLAAEALAAIGRSGARQVLRTLIDRADSVLLRDGAHHVFYDLSNGPLRETLRSVIDALESFTPELAVPIAARQALNGLSR